MRYPARPASVPTVAPSRTPSIPRNAIAQISMAVIPPTAARVITVLSFTRSHPRRSHGFLQAWPALNDAGRHLPCVW